jgi:hypothetical protein
MHRMVIIVITSLPAHYHCNPSTAPSSYNSDYLKIPEGFRHPWREHFILHTWCHQRVGTRLRVDFDQVSLDLDDEEDDI